MLQPTLKLATGSRHFVEACCCCKICIFSITAPNIRQWCLNAGQNKRSFHGTRIGSSSARGKYHWRDAATPRQLGKHPLLLTRGHTSTYHRASFVIFSPAFFAGAHTTKKPASHQHHNKSHGALWLNLFNLIHLYICCKSHPQLE